MCLLSSGPACEEVLIFKALRQRDNRAYEKEIKAMK